MNGRTTKLLRSYARCSDTSLKEAKREWLDTPTSERGKVRSQMEAGVWSTTLRDWRKANKLQQKEAADVLSVSIDTYRGWEGMKSTPPKFARIALGVVMKYYAPVK